MSFADEPVQIQIPSGAPDEQIKVKDFSELNKEVIKQHFVNQNEHKKKKYRRQISHAESQLKSLKKKLHSIKKSGQKADEQSK